MFKLFQKIVSVILVLVILTTTSGFRIYSHDCACCGTDEISFVEFEECCEDEQETMICDLSHQAETACCAEVVSMQHDCEETHCCEINSSFFKLHELFEKAKMLTVKYLKITNYPVQVIDTEPLVERANTGFLDISENSPPKIPIRDFVIFSHSLKIAC